MSTEQSETAETGMSGSGGWVVGGAVGGAIGALAFGALVWALDPAVVQAAIPAIYGLDPVGIVGWGIHVAHGVVLGVLFGFLVTREFILGTLRMTVETDALSRTGVWLRVVAAGFVFGLSIWAILPVLVLPAWVEALGADPAGEFPVFAAESLVGHLLFGTVLGLVFATMVDLTDRLATPPLEE
ncbi:hypothetical protein CV102_03330 [Natronococcus pandeyae]|uniref:Histidine kinase n=1 Tax=Natronococcus pandeyae TaxID=2055836 RepID=A0A8J8TU43_9EURY|nr:hypothetical protein [Natronococcus pandeyae]TYL40614.1 hypothetical protein CV102_03330 [Natronococcus pandeyae]